MVQVNGVLETDHMRFGPTIAGILAIVVEVVATMITEAAAAETTETGIATVNETAVETTEIIVIEMSEPIAKTMTDMTDMIESEKERGTEGIRVSYYLKVSFHM